MPIRFLRPAVVLLVLIGLAYRLWPAVAGIPALTDFFMTEDGYLMLTVARNMAIGNGMSVSDGTIPTNGVQPLMTFLLAIPYLATGGDKVTSLIGAHLILAGIALAVVPAIQKLARACRLPALWASVAALLWFLGPLLLRHSMNGLETGLATLAILVALLSFGRVIEHNQAHDRYLLGLLCGLAVLARNDAVFFVTSLFLVWATFRLIVQKAGFVRMLTELVPPGLLSIAVAAPWLLNNLLRFGSLVPVSGTAQSMTAGFGQNVPFLPAKVFETAFPMLPIPSSLELTVPVMVVCSLALVLTLALFGVYLARRGTSASVAICLAYLGHALLLAVYYGFFFGADWFLSRYLAPVAPVLIVATLAAALQLGDWLMRSRPEALAKIYAGIGIVLSIGLLAEALRPGATKQGHEQVVAWAQANVPEDTWVGAVQTGTLGYWHDRTYNLDGKVNPEAIAVLRSEGTVLNYVVESEIEYVIDWAGLSGWITAPEALGPGNFADVFELIEHDEAANLAVLQRQR